MCNNIYYVISNLIIKDMDILTPSVTKKKLGRLNTDRNVLANRQGHTEHKKTTLDSNLNHFRIPK